MSELQTELESWADECRSRGGVVTRTPHDGVLACRLGSAPNWTYEPASLTARLRDWADQLSDQDDIQLQNQIDEMFKPVADAGNVIKGWLSSPVALAAFLALGAVVYDKFFRKGK